MTLRQDLHEKSDGTRFLITNEYFTGHPYAILPTLIRSVAQICREGRGVEKFYIGIASGNNHYDALKRRYDQKKAAAGTTHMYLLYQSRTEANTKRLESALIHYFKEAWPDEGNWNDAPGKEGRPTAQPFCYLYVALTKGT